MIYFDKNKEAYADEIKNPIAKIDDDIWIQYAGTDKWDVVDGVFVDITDTEEYKARKEQEKEEKFKKEFFNTSLGYVRRNVNMITGEVKSFLFDILPVLQAGAKIITYKNDGTQITDAVVTEEFIQECKNQIIKDFYG